MCCELRLKKQFENCNVLCYYTTCNGNFLLFSDNQFVPSCLLDFDSGDQDIVHGHVQEYRVNNVWSCTSSLTYVFMVCTGTTKC